MSPKNHLRMLSMEEINKAIKNIISENKVCKYIGYFVDGDNLYVYLFEHDSFTGDGIVIIKENLKTGEKDKTVGIGGLIEWGISLKNFIS